MHDENKQCTVKAQDSSHSRDFKNKDLKPDLET